MKQLANFLIPIGGLKNGIHQYRFEVDDDFFMEIEDSAIENARFDVQLILDKRVGMIVCHFGIEGTMDTACDRCLQDINLPLKGQYQLIFKFGEEQVETDEVVYLPHGENELNMARFVYEYCCLSVPLSRTFDCDNEDNPPCDFDLLTKIEKEQQEEKEKIDNPIWDNLKDLI